MTPPFSISARPALFLQRGGFFVYMRLFQNRARLAHSQLVLEQAHMSKRCHEHGNIADMGIYTTAPFLKG
jgi:hypothetical protein